MDTAALHSNSLMMIPVWSHIAEASYRIKPYIHRTPVLHATYLDSISGATLFFKCENFQKIGAFKIRGATNAVLALHEQGNLHAVATHSSGNHAQAVALAAHNLNIPAYIVMPKTAPEVKKQAVAGYGGKIFLCEPTLESRETTLQQVIAETGAVLVHPYNDPYVIAGQGTAAIELLEDVPTTLDIVMTPVGGGGLLSGTAITVAKLSPSTRVIAGEPAGADDAYRSMARGEIVPSIGPNTLADGLLSSLGDLTFAIMQQYVEQILTVEDDRIIQAMRLVWERMKIIIEPSCAVPLAAVLKYPDIFADKKVGIILTGGNVDLGKLPF